MYVMSHKQYVVIGLGLEIHQHLGSLSICLDATDLNKYIV